MLNSNRNEIEDSTAFTKSLTHRFLSDLYHCIPTPPVNADGDATKAAVAHDDGLDAILGAGQRSVMLSRSVTADGKLSEHALTARQAQAEPRFLRWLRRNPELALCL